LRETIASAGEKQDDKGKTFTGGKDKQPTRLGGKLCKKAGARITGIGQDGLARSGTDCEVCVGRKKIGFKSNIKGKK